MKKVLAIIVYLVCGLILTLLSAGVKSEEVTYDQICFAGIGSSFVDWNSDSCDPNDTHEKTITHTKYGFPLEHASYTARRYDPPLLLGTEEMLADESWPNEVRSFFEHPDRHFYKRELALNTLFWAVVCAGLHFIAIRLMRHKSKRQRTIVGKNNLSSGSR